MENICIIIQARAGSTRLKRKIFADISGKALLWHVIERANVRMLVQWMMF